MNVADALEENLEVIREHRAGKNMGSAIVGGGP